MEALKKRECESCEHSKFNLWSLVEARGCTSLGSLRIDVNYPTTERRRPPKLISAPPPVTSSALLFKR